LPVQLAGFAHVRVSPGCRGYDSEALLAMVQQGSIDATATKILRTCFQQDRDAFWSDAL
jgi:hypothetical protein